jgi:fibronectin-binding autotransporter adhesin
MKQSTPTPNPRHTLALGLCTALVFGSTLTGRATDLVNDTWIDGNRTQPASPTHSENGTDTDADGNLESVWYSSTAANLTVVDDGVPGGNQLLRGTVAAASAISWATYFTPEAAPVTLVNPGDQLRITWVFSLTGLNAASTGQGFRVAVVNSPAAARISSDTTPGSSTYAGYAIFGNMRSGLLGNGESFAIKERTDNTASAALLSASAAWASPSLANGADTTTPGYTAGTPYTYTITFTRTVANELDINATITGTGLGVGGTGLSVSYVDATPNTFTFDTFNTRPQTGNDTATTFDTSLFRVEYLAACVSASISADPTNKTVALGQSASFQVTAGGAAPTYQWQLSTDSGANWNNVASGTGGTTANYSTAATTSPDNGNQYRCIVNVACDSTTATSAVATLSITLPKNLTWVGDGSTNLWDTTTPNWSGDATLFIANDNVAFTDAGSATPAIDLVGGINPNLLTVNAAQDYTIGTTTSGSIGGSAALTKSGSGKLTLSTINSFTGKTTVTGGTLSVAGVSNLGAAPAVFTADQLTLNGGTIEITASGSSAANRGTTLGASGGTFNIPTAVDFVNTPITTGPGSLTKVGAGSLALNVANTYAGGTVISNGTVTVGNASGLGTGLATLAGGTLTFPGATTIGNSLHVAADSTLTFASTANNAVVLNGNLTGAAGRTLTITPTGASTATTRVRINNGLTNSFTFDANLVLNGTFTFATYNNVGDEVYNGVISGAGILGRRSPLAGTAGRTILNGDNTYTGGTVIADGAIGFGLDSTGSPTVTSGPIGTGALSLENNPNTFHRLFASGGARTVGNAITWPAGVNQDLTIEGSDALTLNGDMDLGGSTRTIAANNSATTTLGGVIGNGGLTKTGPGVLLLNGVNTYVGTTTVSNGTLGGLGTIAGSVVVESPGTLAPGTVGIGTLTVNGDLTLNGDTAVDINAGTADEDLITGVATANYGGTLTVNNLAGTLAAGQSYPLFSATTHNGSFASILPATPGAGLSWSFANGVLSVITTPVGQPTLNVSQTGNTLTFSWTGAFKLQAQTNSLSVGLANNWGDYPGGNSSPVNAPIDQANGSVFFRLINQ